MNAYVRTALGSAVAVGLSGPAFSAQPVIATLPATSTLPVTLYDVDYATAGNFKKSVSSGVVDTVISIGLPSAVAGIKCDVQVAWFD